MIDEISKWSVGLGILSFAFFPLAFPILLLTAVALVPLAIPVLLIGLIALPIMLIRRLVARFRTRSARRRQAPLRPPAGRPGRSPSPS